MIRLRYILLISIYSLSSFNGQECLGRVILGQSIPIFRVDLDVNIYNDALADEANGVLDVKQGISNHSAAPHKTLSDNRDPEFPLL